MKKTTTLQVIALLAIGGLGGYMLASRPQSLVQNTVAAERGHIPVSQSTLPTAAPTAQSTAAKSPAVCLTEAKSKAELIAMADPRVAQASARIAATGKKPNILFIMGDDVGWFNIGAYHQGIMSGKTPNLDQTRPRRHEVHRLLRRGKLHGGPGEFHHRRIADPHRSDDRRPGRRRRRPAGPGLHARHRAQGARLRHRPVRQEPPRRLEQVPADGAWLRRILRLPLPPRRHVGPVLVRLSAGLDRQDRSARSGALLRDRRGRSDRAAALGQDRQAEDRR